jgi:hypothetical protein
MTTELSLSAAPELTDEQWSNLLKVRAASPTAVARAYAARRRPDPLLSRKDTLFLVAADHPARGALAGTVALSVQMIA